MLHQFNRKPLALVVFLALPSSVFAFQALSEAELGQVQGQSGIVIDLRTDADGLAVQQVDWTLDKGVTAVNGVAIAPEAVLRQEGLSLRAVDANGVLGGAAHAVATLDIGANGGSPAVQFGLELDRSRLRMDNLRIAGDATRSFGTWALDAEGSLALRSQGGLLNNAHNNTYLKGELRNAKLFYRQLWHEHPYLIMNNMYALWEMPGGIWGVTPEGIHMSTIGAAQNKLNIALDFDIQYKFPNLYAADQGAANEFKITGNELPLMHFGWQGTLKNVDIFWRPGGVWYGSDPSVEAGGQVWDVADGKSQGLWLSSKWDFVNAAEALAGQGGEFKWVFGESRVGGGSERRINFELGDWSRWKSDMASHDFPLIVLDVINAGQGPGGLCWGYKYHGPGCSDASSYSRQFVNLAPGTINDFNSGAFAVQGNARTDGKALALAVRDGNLMSYSRKVALLEYDDAGVASRRNFNWGMIYTFANLNGNIYLYPGGSYGHVDRVPDAIAPINANEDTTGAVDSRTSGMIADVMLMSQTFGATDDAATTIDERKTQGFNWEHGSHLMIGDTDIDDDGLTGEERDGMGIGLISSNFLFMLDDTRIWLKPYTLADSYSGGIDLLTKKGRIHIKTYFGGGVLPKTDGTYGAKGIEVVKGSYINLNLEGLINFRMSPARPADATATGSTKGRQYLAYSGAIRGLDITDPLFAGGDGTFLSFAEPGDIKTELRFAKITGDIAITDGRIDLRGTNEDGDGKPKLVLSQTLHVGASAAARLNDAVTGTVLPGLAAGQPLDIGRVEFSGKTLGRIVVPNAQIYSSMTLKPQN